MSQGWCCQLYYLTSSRSRCWNQTIYKQATKAVVSSCEGWKKCCIKTCLCWCMCSTFKTFSSLSGWKVDRWHCSFAYWWPKCSSCVCDLIEKLFIHGLRHFEWISGSYTSSNFYLEVWIIHLVSFITVICPERILSAFYINVSSS